MPRSGWDSESVVVISAADRGSDCRLRWSWMSSTRVGLPAASGAFAAAFGVAALAAVCAALAGVALDEAAFTGVALDEAALAGASLTGVALAETVLAGAVLADAALAGAALVDAALEGAVLAGAACCLAGLALDLGSAVVCRGTEGTAAAGPAAFSPAPGASSPRVRCRLTSRAWSRRSASNSSCKDVTSALIRSCSLVLRSRSAVSWAEYCD
ncbi:pentapeptide repeat-containing protein [Streptomyces sp. NPDC088736]|uniref:pentapeptide repeat-containing protein n=1 Tax=Streptomyces sp. NPDC088736 TaxID=3365881 RepID=UPI00381DE9FB